MCIKHLGHKRLIVKTIHRIPKIENNSPKQINLQLIIFSKMLHQNPDFFNLTILEYKRDINHHGIWLTEMRDYLLYSSEKQRGLELWDSWHMLTLSLENPKVLRYTWPWAQFNLYYLNIRSIISQTKSGHIIW